MSLETLINLYVFRFYVIGVVMSMKYNKNQQNKRFLSEAHPSNQSDGQLFLLD